MFGPFGKPKGGAKAKWAYGNWGTRVPVLRESRKKLDSQHVKRLDCALGEDGKPRSVKKLTKKKKNPGEKALPQSAWD